MSQESAFAESLQQILREQRQELFFGIKTTRAQRAVVPDGFMPPMPAQVAVAPPDTSCHCHVCQLCEVQQEEHTSGLGGVPGGPDAPEEGPGLGLVGMLNQMEDEPLTKW